MIPDPTPAQWAALLRLLVARDAGHGADTAETALIAACGSQEAAWRLLSWVTGQARRTGVPAHMIADAGTRPADTLRHAPPRVATTRWGATTLPRRVEIAAPVPLVEQRPGRAPSARGGARPPADVIAGWIVAAGACLVPVLVAVQMWRGAR